MPLISRRGFSGLKIPRIAEAALKKVRNLHERTDHRVRPFGGEPINPAWEAVKAMKDEIAGAKSRSCRSRP